MEHPCPNCNAAVPEGAPFCSNCGAPQIRVVAPNEPAEVLPPGDTEGSSAPQPFPPVTSGAAQGQSYGNIAAPIEWRLAWRGALFAGIGTALLSAIPIVSLGCCLWLLGGGAVSVLLYQRKLPGVIVTPGMGIRLGAATGAIAYAIYAVFYTALGVLKSNEFRQIMQESIERAAARNSDQQSQQVAEQLINWLSTPQGAATFFVSMLVFLGIVFLGFSAAGGALGASLFANRRTIR